MFRITFRTNEVIDAALADLTNGERDRSQAIRDAIILAWRTRQDDRLRAEAAVLAADADDLAEARSVLVDMHAMRAG